MESVSAWRILSLVRRMLLVIGVNFAVISGVLFTYVEMKLSSHRAAIGQYREAMSTYRYHQSQSRGHPFLIESAARHASNASQQVPPLDVKFYDHLSFLFGMILLASIVFLGVGIVIPRSAALLEMTSPTTDVSDSDAGKQQGS